MFYPKLLIFVYFAAILIVISCKPADLLSSGHIIDVNKPDTSRDKLSALSYTKHSSTIDESYGNPPNREVSDGDDAEILESMKNTKSINAAIDGNQNLINTGVPAGGLSSGNPSKSNSLYSSIFDGGK
uniref:Uncharacterized protein n=1 Tax=Panagrolaimus sp. ES5 TaxID=591445 RepID=A0AC34GK00_9BILA